MLRIISISLLLAVPVSALRLQSPTKTLEDREADEALQILSEKVEMLAHGKVPEPSKLETAKHTEAAFLEGGKWWREGTKWRQKEIEKEERKKDNCAIVFLHGIGVYHPASMYTPVFNQMGGKYSMNCKKMVYPKAPLLQMMGENAFPVWYHVERPYDLSPDYHPPHYGSNMSEVEENIPLIHGYIDNLINYGIPSTKIFVGGHSQGSTMAASAGLSYPKTLGGIFMVSGAVDGDTETNKKFQHPANAKTPIHWEHSENDGIMSIKFMEIGAPELRKMGHEVETYKYETDHASLPEGIFQRVGNFIKKNSKEEQLDAQ